MADKTGYIGRNPGDSNVIIARQTYQPTGVQTTYTFNTGYTPGYLDVYLNGTKLIRQLDFLDQTGGTVDIISPPTLGDVVEIVAYKAYSLGAPINSVAGDFSVGGNISVGGSFSVTQALSFTDLFVSGISTFTKDINANSNLNVTGVSTFTGNVSFASSALFGDNDKILLGNDNDLEIFHGTGSWIRSVNPASNFFITSGLGLQLRVNSAEIALNAVANGATELFYNNDEKLETTDDGINVTGHTETDTLNVSGISTFESPFVRMAAGGGNSGTLKFGSGNEFQIKTESSKLQFSVAADRSIELRHGGSVFLRTTDGGINVVGGGLTVSGISTFFGNVEIGTGGTIFSPSSNVLALGTNSEERLRITSVGDININSGVTLRWGSTNAAGIIGKEGSTDGYLAFAPNNTGNDSDKLRILSDGKVGIGTTNPTYLLHTQNNGALGSTENERKYIARFTSNTGNRLNLDIYDRRWEDTQTHNWKGTEKRIEYNVDGNANKRMWVSFFNPDGTTGNNVIRFGEQEDTEWMRIGDGLLGIGITNPSHKLQVGDGTVNSTNAIKLGKRVTSSQSNLPLIGHYSPDGTASGLALCATSSSGGIHFFTGNDTAGFGNGSNDERARITNSGHIEIIDGDLVVASGHGVNFSATGGPINSATGVSGLLDDYERGYWTPIISNAVNQPSYTYNAVNGGWYVKVGKVVHVGFNLRATHSMATPSGTWRIDGLPYTVSAQNNGTHGNAAYSAGVISYVNGIFNLPSNSTGVGFLFIPNNDQMQVYSQRRNQISLTLDSSYMKSGTTVDLNLHGQGSYLVD